MGNCINITIFKKLDIKVEKKQNELLKILLNSNEKYSNEFILKCISYQMTPIKKVKNEETSRMDNIGTILRTSRIISMLEYNMEPRMWKVLKKILTQ